LTYANAGLQNFESMSSTFCDMLNFYSKNLLVPHPAAFIHVLYFVYFTCIKMTIYFIVCDILFGMIEYT